MLFIRKHKFKFLTVTFALLLISPQLIFQQVLFGSDILFHFNRFYDTAMQIKHGNWQYFLSLYGFQQSGRIVNALYGPLIAYLHGSLVLLCGTWFRYQLLANFSLYLLAGSSMNTLLKKNQISPHVRCLISCFFMTTFAIQYWTTRQGFSSWGAALMPLCLLPVKELAEQQKISSWSLGLSVAALVQTHLFSAVLLVLIYAAYFVPAWCRSPRKKALFRELVLSLVIFVLFTLNIWTSYYKLYSENQLIAPFVNRELYLNTITAHSFYWLVTPLPLLFFIIWQYRNFWRQGSLLNRQTLRISSIFLLLTTNLIPWHWLQQFKAVAFLQFPFRFFVPFTVLFLLAFGLTLDEQRIRIGKKAWLIIGVSLLQTIGLFSFLISQQMQDPLIFAGKHDRYLGQAGELQRSVHSKVLTETLHLLNKSTPDYLPLYQQTTANNYQMYREQIIEAPSVQKTIVDQQLVVTWHSPQTETIQLPVIVYRGTQLQLNGQPLTPDQLTLSPIGVPSIPAKQGRNQLTLAYPATTGFNRLCALIGCLWLAAGSYYWLNSKVHSS